MSVGILKLGNSEECLNSLLGRRDAFHVACVLCTWDEDYQERPAAGLRVRFTGDAFSEVRPLKNVDETAHGIIDPFLQSPLTGEDMFWVLLMPGLASSPQHNFDLKIDDVEYKGQWDCRDCPD
jgi:hypothetical protein